MKTTNNKTIKIRLKECVNCSKEFGLSDAEKFERFCSALCEAEHKQEWAESKREELEHERVMENLNDQELIEDMRLEDEQLQNWMG